MTDVTVGPGQEAQGLPSIAKTITDPNQAAILKLLEAYLFYARSLSWTRDRLIRQLQRLIRQIQVAQSYNWFNLLTELIQLVAADVQAGRNPFVLQDDPAKLIMLSLISQVIQQVQQGEVSAASRLESSDDSISVDADSGQEDAAKQQKSHDSSQAEILVRRVLGLKATDSEKVEPLVFKAKIALRDQAHLLAAAPIITFTATDAAKRTLAQYNQNKGFARRAGLFKHAYSQIMGRLRDAATYDRCNWEVLFKLARNILSQEIYMGRNPFATHARLSHHSLITLAQTCLREDPGLLANLKKTLLILNPAKTTLMRFVPSFYYHQTNLLLLAPFLTSAELAGVKTHLDKLNQSTLSEVEKLELQRMYEFTNELYYQAALVKVQKLPDYIRPRNRAGVSFMGIVSTKKEEDCVIWEQNSSIPFMRKAIEANNILTPIVNDLKEWWENVERAFEASPKADSILFQDVRYSRTLKGEFCGLVSLLNHHKSEQKIRLTRTIEWLAEKMRSTKKPEVAAECREILLAIMEAADEAMERVYASDAASASVVTPAAGAATPFPS